MDHVDTQLSRTAEKAAVADARSRHTLTRLPDHEAATALAEPAHVASAPRINRGSMVPVPWVGFWKSLSLGMGKLFSRETVAPVSAEAPAWQRAAIVRRRVLLALIALSSMAAAGLLVESQPMFDSPVLRFGQVGLYTLLFAWVSAGFYTAMMGFYVQLKGDKHALSARSVDAHKLSAEARTAVIMPICNEHVSTVFAGLRATCESLAATGDAKTFDVFILSDSGDPTVRAAELAAWEELRTTLGDKGAHVHYRWRQRRVKKKAGNVADFCRRWGKDYRYMVVLDADSVMSGESLVTLAKLMEANPKAGIIQTAPQACGLSTLHARAQQFSGRVVGALFTAGMQYWQLGESHYWGHNAIIRVDAFMKHCALAPLKGTGGLSGEIMSHDFVEAALITRAGYEVWLCPDLEGSYEQQPPNLLEELSRDRRWCQGNLQNGRLVAEPGIKGVHRAMLVTGVMAYASAPLWLAFIVIGVALWAFGGDGASMAQRGLPTEMIALWGATLTMLFLPRVLAVASIVMKGQQKLYGGTATLIKGSLLEASLSVLQAPMRMVAHTIYVVVALTGLKLKWKSPPREAEVVPWGDAAKRFGWQGLVAAAVLGSVLAVAPAGAIWLAFIAVPLMLAIPLSVLTSHGGIGERVKAREILATPEEASTPQVLRHAWTYARRASPAPAWHEVVTNPWLYNVVRFAMGPRDTLRGRRGAVRRQWVESVSPQTAETIEAMSSADRMRLLSEPQTIVRLHQAMAANAEWERERAHAEQAGERALAA